MQPSVRFLNALTLISLLSFQQHHSFVRISFPTAKKKKALKKQENKKH